MPWFKVEGANVRVNGKRYIVGSVVELDAEVAKLNDHFKPCDAPKSAPVAAQMPAKKAEAAKQEAPKADAPKAKSDAVK